MWIPKDVSEIEARIASGDLEETASFEAKQQLPDKKKNAAIATDVAAMATDGGVNAYGIGEDDNRQLTVPSPIPLPGAADRRSQVVSKSTAEVPHIDVREYPSADDPAVGYLFGIVPQSSSFAACLRPCRAFSRSAPTAATRTSRSIRWLPHSPTCLTTR